MPVLPLDQIDQAASIAPFGGAKGYGPDLFLELLAAGVTGSNWSFQTSSLTDNECGPPAVSVPVELVSLIEKYASP